MTGLKRGQVQRITRLIDQLHDEIEQVEDLAGEAERESTNEYGDPLTMFYSYANDARHDLDSVAIAWAEVRELWEKHREKIYRAANIKSGLRR